MRFRENILLALIPVSIFAMGMGASPAMSKTFTLFSEVHGQLIDKNGAPKAGVMVTQWWSESPDDDGQSAQVVTDDDGRFHFSSVERELGFLASILPGTPAVKQRITIDGPDGPLTLWQAVKTSYQPFSETRGRPIDVICYADSPEDGDGPAWGTCRFADSK